MKPNPKQNFLQSPVVMSLLVIACLFSAGVSAQSSMDKAGTVTSVSPDQRTIKVRLDDEDTIETYRVDRETEITFRGSDGDLADLSPGDRVMLDYDDDAAMRSSRSIAVGEMPDDKKAEVLDVNEASRQLTVRFTEDNRVNTYGVSPDTDIWIRNDVGSIFRNRRGDLSDLQEGDEVILDFADMELVSDSDEVPVLRWVTYDFYEPEEASSSSSTLLAANDRLPSTASVFPLIGLGSLLSFGLAGLLRGRRVSRKKA